jgi:hypothetical protein
VVLLPYVAGNSGGASGGTLELGVVLGLALTGAAQFGLRLAWRRVTAKAKRPDAHRARC